MKKAIILFICVLSCAFAAAQDPKLLDSLTAALKAKQPDTSRVNTLNSLSAALYANDPNRSLTYSQEAITLSQKAGYDKGAGIALSMAGNACYYLGDYDKALDNYLQSLAIKEKLGDKKGTAKLSANAAMILENQGKYSESLKYLLRSLAISEKEGDKNGMAAAYNSIGNIYRSRGNTEEALTYYRQASRIAQEVNDLKVLMLASGNMGNVYAMNKKFDEAIGYYSLALKISEQRNDKPGTARALTSMGSVYGEEGNLDKSLELYLRSMKISEEIGNTPGIAECYKNIGDIYTLKENAPKAIDSYTKAMDLNKAMGFKEGLKNVYASLSSSYAQNNDHKLAYKYAVLLSNLKDTLLNEQNSKQMNEMATRYETEKKEQQILVLEKDKALSHAELSQQKYFRNSLIIFCVLVLITVGVTYRGYRNKKKANTLLALQKREIQDSINYALQIQKAMLPDPAEIERAFPEVFGLYLPKDVVSGDFYWFARKEDARGSKTMIAAVDCTGHGVPGAFMSMVGSDKLNAAVIEKHITDPASILHEVNISVKRALKQNTSESKSRDGMDMALCSFDLSNNVLEYAGANRPLVHIRNGELKEIAPTKASIGGHTADTQEFVSHTVELEENDTFYIFSDGYADQFGGSAGKKFMTKKLKQTLLSIQGKPMKEQEKLLHNILLDWKGSHEQVDDILVIGIRV
jgi:serine phosphatase RsbU (regulator of sigma subunit)/lipopolysaccharide biosynthesis regulator YciM